MKREVETVWERINANAIKAFRAELRVLRKAQVIATNFGATDTVRDLQEMYDAIEKELEAARTGKAL